MNLLLAFAVVSIPTPAPLVYGLEPAVVIVATDEYRSPMFGLIPEEPVTPVSDTPVTPTPIKQAPVCTNGVCPIVAPMPGRAVKLLATPLLVPVVSVPAPQYHPQWTMPGGAGNVANHLRQEHGVNTLGMTYADMLLLHDQLHNSGRGQKQTFYRQPVRQRIFRRSCRGGICPR